MLDGIQEYDAQTVPSVRFGPTSEAAKAEIQIGLLKGNMLSELTTYVNSPFDVSTPKEKVKKRPDGYDYIESSWMDKQFKSHSPLYAYELLHYSENHGWVTCIVKLTDRITGNSELGGASVRIQVRQGAGAEPTFRDIIDKGNNIAAVVTRACKNAQSRFGHGADIYGKREAVRTKEENERYDDFLRSLKKLSPNKVDLFKDGWEELGADFSDYLDKWQIFIDKLKESTKIKPVEKKDSSAVDAAVTGSLTSKTIMFN
jgi:hypothetical protein